MEAHSLCFENIRSLGFADLSSMLLAKEGIQCLLWVGVLRWFHLKLDVLNEKAAFF